jgi:hypothetical protein
LRTAEALFAAGDFLAALLRAGVAVVSLVAFAAAADFVVAPCVTAVFLAGAVVVF